jgi:hypothetical protein
MKQFSQLLITLFLFTAFVSCKKDVAELQATNPITRYQVTFQINWNNQDYPTDYPANAHFSKLIGWSHKVNTNLFKIGSLASQGIKVMAESGATTPLDNELAAKIANKEGLAYYIGDNLGSGVGSISQIIEVNNNFSSVSLATMVAPSPDWYLAVVDINLLENGEFVSQKTVVGHIYDAGTDDGATYLSPNSVSSPKQPISLFIDPPMGNGVAITPTIATVTFTKL